jgi:sulfate permease, SulP family
VPDTTIWWPSGPHTVGERKPGIAVVGLQAPLSFLNAEGFHGEVLEALSAAKPRLLVIEASGMVEIDFTAAQTLHDLFCECREAGVTVAVARLESTRAQEAFDRFDLYDVLPREHVFRSVDEAVRALGGQA